MLQYILVPLGRPFNQLQTVDEYLAGHHAGDTGVPPEWGGVGDSVNGPCAIAGMFGCAPVNSTNDYFRDGDVHEGPPVVYASRARFM
mmetsp:Transcript_27281/g.61921  ORF Transcript_27281/g.61921 Transcript_27281/m.61921 type:complete len:87 (-) Transcript_27281:98-358(-)